jgi:single-stranded-DNA-specific exonuclease
MEDFLGKCDEARKYAFSFSDPLIVHHYDADGVSSGSIVAGAFIKENKKFRRECIRKLDDEAIERYSKEQEIIFVDLGGGNKRVNELKDVLIIDHHQTEGIEKFQANPLLHGLDGGSELSASGCAYCVFRVHADLAVVGAVGDMQAPLKGMNRWVLEQGKDEVKVENDLRFYGRYCRPLVQFLAYSDDPFVPGISFREDKAEELLRELGIVYEQRAYADLNDDEKKTLISGLAKILSGANRRTDLIGESYVFPKRPKNETYEANEFSTLLNACGRHNRPDIGVRVCLGDESAYEEARKMLLLHRKMLRDGIEFAGRRMQDLGKFFLLDGRGVIDESIIGIVCGMAMRKKPVIGISSSENNTIKVSGRLPRGSEKNMGNLMKKASEELGGVGGGHQMAAGASLPAGKINEFLLLCGDYF